MATNSLLNNSELPRHYRWPWWGRIWEWLVQPKASLPADAQRRLRFFNILLVTEILAELVGLLLITTVVSSGRILITSLIFLACALPAYLLSRMGYAQPAIWANGLGTLLALCYYNLAVPIVDPTTPFFDLRSTAVLMIIPIIITGLVSGPRSCISLVVISLVALYIVSLQIMHDPMSGLKTDWWFDFVTLRLPTAFLVLSGLLALVFERNIFGLFESLARRNIRLQTLTEQLTTKRERANRLTTALHEVLSELHQAFESQLNGADQQQLDVFDVSSSLEELGRVARRIDSLAGQASDAADEAVKVARQKAEVVRNNALIYGRLEENMESINRAVQDLEVEALQIDQVVSSISEVAEETNLLALNASIESAGRREHGRRFSTVAMEVQRSAQRSREAAEEVRRVVSQVQANVTNLAAMSLESEQAAHTLSLNTRSSARTINEIVISVENSAEINQTILSDVKTQQAAVIGIIDVVPTVSQKGEEMRRFTGRLLQSVQDLEETVAELDSDVQSGKPPLASPSSEAAHDGDDDDWDDEQGFNWQSWRRLSWKRRWLYLTLPNHYLKREDRRRSRLLNLVSLSVAFFLLVYLPISQLGGLQVWTSFVPITCLLIVMLVVYVLSRTGQYTAALLLFFGAVYVFYIATYSVLSDQVQIKDFIKTISVVLGLLSLIAVITANLRWIVWLTFISLVVTSGLAFWRFERSIANTFIALVSPSILLVTLGLLAAFLDLNIRQLAVQLETQNRRLMSDNRELTRKERLESQLSHQIYGLSADLSTSFEHQTRLAVAQLEIIRDITGRVGQLSQGARQLVSTTQQVAQTANDALQQAQQGAIGIESGLHSIEEFQMRVAQISSSSLDLQAQTSEIEQTFVLINDVAEEVDLLALNATVEASQAREAGKRFGAVASEVQRLAGRARSASSKVSLIVRRIQVAVGLCVELTEAGQREIRFLSETAYDTSRSVQEIVQTVNNTSNLVGQIQDAVLQQSSALSETLNRLEAISLAGEIFKESTSASGGVVIRLNTTALELSQGQPIPDPATAR